MLPYMARDFADVIKMGLFSWGIQISPVKSHESFKVDEEGKSVGQRDSMMEEEAREISHDKDLTAISDFEDKEGYKPDNAHDLEAENEPWPTASKDIKPSVLQPQ